MNPYQGSQPVTDPEDFFGHKTEFQMVYRWHHILISREIPESQDDSLTLLMHFIKLAAGQHPLFLSQLCFFLYHFQHYEPDITPDELREQSLHRFLKQAFEHFIYYWEHLSTDEKVVLKKLANGKKPDQDDTAELIDLEQKALIVRDNGNYAVFSAAFEGFVKEIEFSEAEEKVAQFFAKNTKALVSVVRYCLDKAVELKK